MEFDNIGEHCQVIGCGQKDFLPFACDCCTKVFCLDHRTKNSHNCLGGGFKDMTSIECPICGKTVKFDSSQDVNVIWDDHYLNICTQKPTDKTNTVKRKCCKKTCNTILGLSNAFKCQKCLKEVCLSHRIAIDHDCASLNQHKPANRNMLLDRIETTNSKRKVDGFPNINQNTIAGGSGTKTALNNTLKGIAERRKQQDSRTNISAPTTVENLMDQPLEILVCPFCEFLECTGNVSILEAHVASQHAVDGPSTVHSTPVVDLTGHSTDSNSDREVCPQCGARFSDPIALVTHFETAHGQGDDGGTQNGGTAKSDCQIS